MRRKVWILQSLLLLLQYCHLGEAAAAMAAGEGNTTFVEGTSWCVAKAGASQIELQKALDWACGMGKADCRDIQRGRQCYEPNTLVSHASFAFNSYYQQNGNSDIACNFGGTAILTKIDPSYGKCDYSASRSESSLAAPVSKHSESRVCVEIIGILMLLYLGS